MRKKLVAGNWKMNGLRANLKELDRLSARFPTPPCEIVICPPTTVLAAASGREGLRLGGQDCHPAQSGAHTGDISAAMLADCGAHYVIVGHSERRTAHREDNQTVHAKASAALEAGLTAIVCVGETEAEQAAGATLDVLAEQLAGSLPKRGSGATVVIAYEPVWAIGTGKTPTPDQIAHVHAFLRARMVDQYGQDDGEAIRLLYGGSVKATNAADIFALSDVDGALVGGASLKAEEFIPIVEALAVTAR